MTKKVLISLGDVNKILDKDFTGSPHYCADYDYVEAGVNDTVKSICKDIGEWFDEQPPAPQWVSVEDDLPKFYEPVFILQEKKLGYSHAMHGDKGYLYEKGWSNGWFHVSVTHWMPIPELPEVKE